MSMTVTCPSCSDSFPVDPAKIPAGGIKARCSSCQGIIDIQPPAADAPVAPAVDTPPAMGSDAAVAGPERDGTDEFGEREVTFDEPIEPPAPEPEVPTVEAPAPEAPAMETPAAETPATGTPTPETPSAPDDADSAFAAIAGDGAADADAPAAESTPAAAPIQFGKRTPEDKAKSLARSLVSDIIAYHTDKHAEAKAAGTLPQVFEEEVEKCWKEYQEQVDPGVVQNNTFLTDALNDILADGEAVFNLPG